MSHESAGQNGHVTHACKSMGEMKKLLGIEKLLNVLPSILGYVEVDNAMLGVDIMNIDDSYAEILIFCCQTSFFQLLQLYN